MVLKILIMLYTCKLNIWSSGGGVDSLYSWVGRATLPPAHTHIHAPPPKFHHHCFDDLQTCLQACNETDTKYFFVVMLTSNVMCF